MRFKVQAQREGGQRAELSNLTANELQIAFDAVSDLPTITKKRQGGTRVSETCRMRHWGCGPYCHTEFIKKPDQFMPSLAELAGRAEQYLALPHEDQGICGACAFTMTNAVLNVSWHAQNASVIPPAIWLQTDRNSMINRDQRQVLFLPELKFGENSKRAILNLDSEVSMCIGRQPGR